MLAFLDYTHPLLVSSTPLAVLFVSELLSRFYLPIVERETSRLGGRTVRLRSPWSISRIPVVKRMLRTWIAGKALLPRFLDETGAFQV
jgi:hypothetical protein